MAEDKMTIWQRTSLAAQVAKKIIRADEQKGDPVFPRGPAAHWADVWGRPLSVNFAGSSVDYQREVGPLWTSSLVMAVINFVGTLLTEAPPLVSEYEENGNLTPVINHPLPIMLESPNPYHTGDAFWLAFALSWFIDGNVYWLKERDPRTLEVVRLWYLPHFLVTPIWNRDDPNSFISAYRYTVDGRRVDYLVEDIIHFKRGIDPENPRKGLGAFNSVLREIYGDNMAANFSAVVLKNWGVVPFVISPPKGRQGEIPEGFSGNEVEVEAKARAIKDAFIRATTGDEKGLPVVNTIPLEITKLGHSPQELDIGRLRNVPESRVAGVTGIPAAVLQFIIGLENGTSYASYEQAIKHAYNMAVKPIIGIAQSTIQKDLLSEFGSARGRRQKFFFDLSQVQVLQEDRNKLYERASTGLEKGGITLNQFLASVGKPTVEGGDIYYVPKAVQPMTLEAMIKLSKDPQLAAATTDRRAPVPPPEPPDEPPAKSQKKSLKSVTYEGMTLWREPNDVERAIGLKAIKAAFDEGEQSLRDELAALRKKLIDDALAGIIKLSPAEYHSLTVTVPEDAAAELRDKLQTIYDHARELVVQELQDQGATVSGPGDQSDEDVETLNNLGDITGSRVANDVQARVVGAAAGLVALNLVSTELADRLREEVDAGTESYVEMAAREADHGAFGLGRTAEGEAQSDVVTSVYYSAILDEATCQPCLDKDEETGATVDDITACPNPDCLGGAQCRCIQIFVFEEVE